MNPPLFIVSLVGLCTVTSGATLEQTVVQLLSHYALPLQQNHSPLLIEQFADTTEAHRLQRDHVDRILSTLQGQLAIQLDVSSKPSANNLIFIDGYLSARRFFLGWNEKRYDLGGFYLIVLGGVLRTPRNYDLIQHVLAFVWELKLANSIVAIASDQRKDVDLFTYWPYSATYCGEVHPIALNWTVAQPFANKPGNFYGCPLKFGAFHNPPYVTFETTPRGELRLSGFEALLIEAIAQHLNFTIQVITPPENTRWGVVGTHGNSTGLIGMIASGEVDFSANSLGISIEHYAIMAPGFSHYCSHVIFGVPSGRPYSSFEKLLMPFQMNSWFAMLVVLVIAGVCIVVIDRQPKPFREFVYGRGINLPITNLINLLFGGPLPTSPRTTFARTLLMHWLIFTLVIRTAYQGSLYKYLQVPKNYSAPLTMDAIDQSGLLYHMMYGSDVFVGYLSKLPRTRFFEQTEYTERIRQLASDELDGALVLLADTLAYHNKFAPPDQFIQGAREKITGYPVTIFYPKRTVLRGIFDWDVRWIVASGLMQYWASRNGDYEFFRKRGEDAVAKELSLGNLVGIFQALIILEVSAVGVFLVEVVSLKVKVVRRVLSWFE